MQSRDVGFFEKAIARRDGVDPLEKVLVLEKDVMRLEVELSEMKSMLIKSMQQMQDIYFKLLKEPSIRSETNDFK